MANLVDSWLNGIGLGYAVPIFAGQGIDTPDMLSELDVVDFPELGISDQNDRKKVCSRRTTLKQSHGLVDCITLAPTGNELS